MIVNEGATKGAARKGIALALSFLCLALATPTLAAGPDVTPLVSTAWLAEHQTDEGVVVLDLRPAATFEQGHVPNAVQADFPGRWSVESDGVPSRLPETAVLEAYLTELGITNETTVVIVSSGLGINDLTAATWVYWVLKYLGLEQVAILDGGWDQWVFDRLPEEAGATTPTPGTPFAASPREDFLADTDYVANHLGGDVILIDARPEQQYTGAVVLAGMITRPGHIPGAINVPNDVFYDRSADRFAPRDILEAQVPSELADPTAALIVYCSIGQASSMSWFVFHELLGYQNVRLYEASMAAWSWREDLPLVTGPSP